MRRHQFETYLNKVFDFSTEVVALLEPVYRTNPEDRAVDYALGTALIREGQVQRGESIVDRILKDRDTAEANLLTGEAQFAAGDYKTAATTLRKALDRIFAVLERNDHWQAGLVFPKGQNQALRAQGIEAARKSLAETEPHFAKHAESLTDWSQLNLLSAESSRGPLWHKPGVLVIGDAAHVMSPVGGVGINSEFWGCLISSPSRDPAPARVAHPRHSTHAVHQAKQLDRSRSSINAPAGCPPATSYYSRFLFCAISRPA